MTPPAAPDSATDRRTVGDILLARGYVTQAQLDHAIASQQRSGKPLGQVLVEAGAITRLELASALAEQWSDTASWLGPPAGEGRARPGRGSTFDPALSHEAQEAGFQQQLHEAVVELARRVASFEPGLTDLRVRFEAVGGDTLQELPGRIDAVESALTTIWRRLDELTDGIERALDGIEQGSAAISADVEALTRRAGELASVRDLEELRAAVAELATRPAGDPALPGRLDELAGRVASLAERDTVDRTAAAVAELTTRVDRIAEALAAQPQPDLELPSRIADLAARLDAADPSAALEELRSAVRSLQERAGAEAALATRVDDLAARLEGISHLASTDDADGLAELAGNLGALTARVEALAERDALDAVRARLDQLADPPPDPRLEALDARADELLSRLEELSARVEGISSLASTDGGEGLAELAGTVGALTARVESLADRGALEELRAELAGLSRRQDDSDVARRLELFGGRLDELAGRVEAVAARERGAETDEAAALHAQLERLAERLDLLERQSAEPPTAGAETDVELIARLDALANELQSARQAWSAERVTLEERIAALAARLDPAAPGDDASAAAEPAPAATPAGPMEAELERLRMAVERINLHLSERERAIAELVRTRSAEPRVEELAARLAELEQAAPAPAAAGGEGAGGDLHAELRRLAQRVEEAEQAARSDREKVLTQLERMASSIDWRFRRLETGEEDEAA